MSLQKVRGPCKLNAIGAKIVALGANENCLVVRERDEAGESGIGHLKLKNLTCKQIVYSESIDNSYLYVSEYLHFFHGVHLQLGVMRGGEHPEVVHRHRDSRQ